MEETFIGQGSHIMPTIDYAMWWILSKHDLKSLLATFKLCIPFGRGQRFYASNNKMKAAICAIEMLS